MDLYEKMKKDLINAMKEKDKERLDVLRLVKGAMQLENINNKK
ncbi:MAG: GatB/YqeY domain-containing protein [bacterium]|nr:GatB/YqeY domain-containing protein [bacterium]